ncbi:STM3941 family protein [Shewanella algae]|uniref:STM3941 family protein n=1 Tax=Shewanella algae TaxID=38313 RepID=UPI0031F48A68
MLDEKVIELSKVKIMLIILGAIVFVLLGLWFLSMDAQAIESQKRFNNPVLIYGIGIVSVVFFGLCGLVGIKKLFDSSPGLVISSKGILDNSSGMSAGVIPWKDVAGVGEYQVKKQRFISILLKDPEKYANNGNALRIMANRANIKMCGTPVSISANSLKISYEDLLGAITEYYRKSSENA